MKNPSIIIIGAGASGIACVSRLLKNDFTNILIIEAENRIGGRINSVKIDEGFVDFGAEFCHGSKNNIVYEMASRCDLLEQRVQDTSLTYSNGEAVDEDLVKSFDSFLEEFDLTENRNSTEKSVGEYFLERYNFTVLQKYRNDPEKYKIAKEAISIFENYYNAIDGSFSWYNSAYKSNFKDCEGDMYLYWKGVGYKSILDILLDIYPNPAKSMFNDEKLILNKEVSLINWENETVIVKCKDNTEYSANHIIFTPSVGVLKSNLIKFVPELTENKQEAINETGYDSIFKGVLYFKNPWWKSTQENLGILWSEEDKVNITTQFPQGPTLNRTSWLFYLETLSFNKYNPNILHFWFSGALVPEIEKLSDEILMEGTMFVLRKFFGNKYNITNPEYVMRSSWYSNPHFRGTYSYETLNIFKSKEKFPDILAYPLLNKNGTPLVLFAGEATNPHHYATVHGAIESGLREAERIIELYSK